MCGDMTLRVPLICLKLNTDALLAANLQPLNSPEQFRAFSGEHGTDDELDAAALLQLAEVLQIYFVLLVLRESGTHLAEVGVLRFS